MKNITIQWHKVTDSTFRDFLDRFGDKHGIYMVGDAEYKGHNTYRSITTEEIYIGQAGGGARREKETKTSGKYVKGSLDARYRSGSYTNVTQAAAGTMSFNNENMGIDIKRPYFFGIVHHEDREHIKVLESLIIQIYNTHAEKYGYSLVNRNKTILLEKNVEFHHTGNVPTLLDIKK